MLPPLPGLAGLPPSLRGTPQRGLTARCGAGQEARAPLRRRRRRHIRRIRRPGAPPPPPPPLQPVPRALNSAGAVPAGSRPAAGSTGTRALQLDGDAGAGWASTDQGGAAGRAWASAGDGPGINRRDQPLTCTMMRVSGLAAETRIPGQPGRGGWLWTPSPGRPVSRYQA